MAERTFSVRETIFIHAQLNLREHVQREIVRAEKLDPPPSVLIHYRRFRDILDRSLRPYVEQGGDEL